MYRIVLIRHGESQWNEKGLFTGWTDVDLSTKGIKEAIEAGKELKKQGFIFDVAFSSLLKRAIKTLNLVLEEIDELWLPVVRDWRLNERHYGNLQGLNKKQMVKKFGEEQVLIWRRSYDVRPPKIETKNKYNQKGQLRYKGIPVPAAESLKDVVARVEPFWEKEIAPVIKSGKRVIIAASGNSLRALIKYLDKISEKDITDLNIPTAIPLVYELDNKLKPIRHYYLASPKKLKAAIEGVKNQGKGK